MRPWCLGWDLRCGLESPTFVKRRAHGAGVTCIAPSPHDPHVVATGSYDDNLRVWDVRQTSRPVESAVVGCGGGVWRCRWHPSLRRLACAAMGGGAAVVAWSGGEDVALAASSPGGDGGGGRAWQILLTVSWDAI